MATVIATNQAILVAGGGISGMTADYGASAKDAGLDGQLIEVTKLEEIAGKPAKG